MSALFRRLLRFPRLVLEWAPIWAPIAITTQIAVLGLRPALQEHRRLEREESNLEARYGELSEERMRLDLQLEALNDPLYLERELRALRDPKSTIR